MNTKNLWTVFVCMLVTLYVGTANATVSFSSSSNSQVTLATTVANDDGGTVFVFKGLATGETSTIAFAIDSECPMVAMTGGAKFTSNWSCSGGVITTSVEYKGGLSFGPSNAENAGSFYITFTNPPAAPGSNTPPAALSGIQISLYGDVSNWSLTGEQTAQGVSFGVELSGPSGGAAHFLMDLPQSAVTFLGEILGITVGGKPYPFATVTSNADGSVSIAVDIEKLEGSSSSSASVLADTVTKKILAGERTLGIASNKVSVKKGGSFSLAMCAGKTFAAGDKVTIKFLLGGKSSSALNPVSLKLDASGCASKKIKLNKSLVGKLVSQVAYKGKKASASIKITK